MIDSITKVDTFGARDTIQNNQAKPFGWKTTFVPNVSAI
jgi:hypothetical protein